MCLHSRINLKEIELMFNISLWIQYSLSNYMVKKVYNFIYFVWPLSMLIFIKFKIPDLNSKRMKEKKNTGGHLYRKPPVQWPGLSAEETSTTC